MGTALSVSAWEGWGGTRRSAFSLALPLITAAFRPFAFSASVFPSVKQSVKVPF